MTVSRQLEASADAPDVNSLTKHRKPRQRHRPGPTEELLAQANDRYLRARADFENYRKRMGRELSEIRESAAADHCRVLNVFDMFLLASIMPIRQPTWKPETRPEYDPQQFNAPSKTSVSSAWKPSDRLRSNFHEAISRTKRHRPGSKIIREWKAGFLLNANCCEPQTSSFHPANKVRRKK